MIHMESLGGACPTQATGYVDGVEFYFRSRWDSWRMSVGGDPVTTPEFSTKGYDDAAGWLSDWEAIPYILYGASRYAKRKEKRRRSGGNMQVAKGKWPHPAHSHQGQTLLEEEEE